jgi:hypothetical protein
MISVLAWMLLASAAAPYQSTSAIPRSKVDSTDHLDKEIEHIDPSLGGWDTEVLSNTASTQLKELSKGLMGVEPIKASDLPAWVPADIQSSRVRPAELVDCDGSHGLALRRGDIDPNTSPGREELANSLEELREFLNVESGAHAKIKVVRVIGSPPVTELLFRVWGERANGQRVQSDAIWSCAWRRNGEGLELKGIKAYSYTESVSEAAFFSECSEAVMGATKAWTDQFLRGTNEWCGEIELGAGMDQYAHSGLTVLDIDDDGLEDIYVCQPGGLPNRLLRQLPDGRVEEVAAQYGLDWIDNTMSALWLDLDGDGAHELTLSGNAGIMVCKRQNTGSFEVAKHFGTAGGYSMAAVDYDGDQLLDLYVCKYSTSDTKSGLPAPYHDANNGPANFLYRNAGNLEFKDVTSAVGLDHNNTRFSFAGSWADYDEDGDPDLYVANDFGRNCLYRNDNGLFKDVAAEAGVEDISAGMGVSWGDYDGDGHLDIYISNMFSSAGQRIAYQRSFKSSSSGETRALYQRHARGNSLFRNRGDGTFEDVAVQSGTWMGRWSWGAGFADLDNDGDRDLFIPNGFITNESTKDL